jgi:hypothetical protein
MVRDGVRWSWPPLIIFYPGPFLIKCYLGAKSPTMTRIFTTLFLLLALSATSQDLYIPRDVQQAYNKETRSMDGMPGVKYWQNRARYDIQITALPPSRILNGSEVITYYNNSPDTLRNPVIKLFLNIHKPGAPRDQTAQPDYLTKGMEVEKVTVNGQPYTWNQTPFLSTWQPLRLPKPLAPHDSLRLTFDWNYEISLQSGREGMIDSTTYFLAYFYPRVAVYDDYAGWDRMDFVDGKEFYSDFNDYTVTVHAPKNYLVVGTGTLLGAETLLQPDILKRYRATLTSDQVIRIVTKEDLDAKRVTAQNAINHWTFRSTNIPDVAFAMSDHYNWDGCSVVVDDKTGRRAGAYAHYNDTAKDYHSVAEYARHSLDWLSRNWPGVPYPYEKSTVVQGYAGMEYPMMANDETYDDPNFSRFVAEHEIAHTYMPFYMGINESRYGFMDEGWATTFELLIGTADLGKEKAEELYRMFRVGGWIRDKGQAQDIPIITPASSLTGAGLGNNEYGKPSLGYLAMKDMLGDSLFKKCLQTYMARWNGKHPTPWDFFFTFNNVSLRNLNWFWKAWFFDNSYIDLAVKEQKKTKSGYTLTLANIGGMPAPADLTATYADGSREIIHIGPATWEKNLREATINLDTKKVLKSVVLEGGIWMDADESNNSLEVK